MDLLQILNNSQSIEANTRRNAEDALKSLGESNVNELIKGLAEIGSDSTINVGLRQSALVLLDQMITTSWRSTLIGTRVNIRNVLLTLASDSLSKIRSLTARSIASVAEQDYPDDWPELLPGIFQLLNNGSDQAVLGGLEALESCFRDAFSEEDFFAQGQNWVDILYDIASGERYSLQAKTQAIETFALAMQFVQMKDYSAIKPAVEAIVGRWVDLMCNIINPFNDRSELFQLEGSSVQSQLRLKISSISAIESLETLIPDITENFHSRISSSVLWALKHHSVLLNDPDFDHYSDVCTLLVNELQVIQALAEKKSLLVESQNVLNELLDALINCCLISHDLLSWEYDPNSFITEETGLSMATIPRSATGELIDELGPDVLNILLPLCLQKALDLVGFAQESAFYILQQILLSSSPAGYPPDFITTLFNAVSRSSNNSLLSARLLLVSATFCKTFSSRIDSGIKMKLLSTAVDASRQSSSIAVRLAAVLAVNRMLAVIPTDRVKHHQLAIFESVSELIPAAEEDTPAVLVETLTSAIRIDPLAAIDLPVATLLFKLASKDISNVQLVADIHDAAEEFIQDAADNGKYEVIKHQILGPLMNEIEIARKGLEAGASEPYSYSSNLVLALDLLGVLLENGENGEELDISVQNSLTDILLVSQDDTILQLGSEALTSLIKRGTVKESETEHIIKAVARLLEPDLGDLAAQSVGGLISAVIAAFGARMGDLLPQMLQATARRLAGASSPLLIDVRMKTSFLVNMTNIESSYGLLSIGSPVA